MRWQLLKGKWAVECYFGMGLLHKERGGEKKVRIKIVPPKLVSERRKETDWCRVGIRSDSS